MASLVAGKTIGLKVFSYSQSCMKHSGRILALRGYQILSSKQNYERQSVLPQTTNCCRQNKVTGGPLTSACRFKSHYENRSTLEYDDLVALIDSGDIYLIDVRDVKEIDDQGAFPDALNIPLTDLKKALKLSDEDYKAKFGRCKPKKTDTNIVFASQKEVKSSAACEIAHKLGYDKSRQYVNGYEEWQEKQGAQKVST